MPRDAVKKTCLAVLLAGAGTLLLSSELVPSLFSLSSPSSLVDPFVSTGHLRSLAEKKLTKITWKPRDGRRRLKRPVAKPVMYTFYNRDGDGSKMGQLANRMQATAWASAWVRAGWDIKILTMEDAEHHPDYEKYRPFFADERPFGTQGSNSFCRWFAMAAAVDQWGGWMSDIDVFPLQNFTGRIGTNLPNGGRLTTHAERVPALVSGTKDEWTRMAKALADLAREEAARRKKDDIGDGKGKNKADNVAAAMDFSDLEALGELNRLHEKEGGDKKFETTEWTMSGMDFFRTVPSLDTKGCDEIKSAGRLAFHFSREDYRRAMEEAKLPEGSTLENRWEVCEGMVGKWDSVCKAHLEKEHQQQSLGSAVA